ncbi:MAG TPA: ATPase [Alphaproteobacteria bacterium]|nr:ATPase [Alphaproteobacteria bacterium]
MRTRPAHIIVVGNEKGGAGKTTLSMHLTVALMTLGKRVAGIDLDSRQQSFARYVANRRRWITETGAALKLPDMAVVERSSRESRTLAEGEERTRLERTLSPQIVSQDFVVIDCPGQDNFLTRLAHSLADTLVTPINDSFIDFDVLGEVDPVTFKVSRPSLYSENVWESRKRRMNATRRSIDWIVVRNRLSALDTKNKKRVGDALAQLAPRIGFRIGPGISERVLYRELFPMGLTLFDFGPGAKGSMTLSHVAARAEMRDFIHALRLPGVTAQTVNAPPSVPVAETDAAAE